MRRSVFWMTSLAILFGVSVDRVRAQEGPCPITEAEKKQAADQIPVVKLRISGNEAAAAATKGKLAEVQAEIDKVQSEDDAAADKLDPKTNPEVGSLKSKYGSDYTKSDEYKSLNRPISELRKELNKKLLRLLERKLPLAAHLHDLEDAIADDKSELRYLTFVADGGKLRLDDPGCSKIHHAKKTTRAKKPAARPREVEQPPLAPAEKHGPSEQKHSNLEVAGARPGGTNLVSPTTGSLPILVEALGWGGAATASSFGSDFDTGFWGGRVAARLSVGEFRLQGDIQGERSSDYSAVAGNRGYVAGGLHLDLAWRPNTEIGIFGGLQDAKPTFHGPESTNYFVGLEGRYFVGPAVLGAQFGRFDVASGPGTLSNAWFVEGRVRVSLGQIVQAPWLNRTTIGGELGFGSGTVAGLNLNAQTTSWGIRATQGIADTAVSLFLAYEHFDNRVAGMGQVWNENMVKGGVKVLFPGSDTRLPSLEPTMPLPSFLLRAVTNY